MINNYIGNNIWKINTKETWQQATKAVAVQIDLEGDILGIRRDLGKLDKPRIYTIKYISEEFRYIKLWQAIVPFREREEDIKFDIFSGRAYNLKCPPHRSPSWGEFRIVPYIN